MAVVEAAAVEAVAAVVVEAVEAGKRRGEHREWIGGRAAA